MKKVIINGKTLRVERGEYRDGSLAVTVEEEYYDEVFGGDICEPFGCLTVNLAPYSGTAALLQNGDHAFVKDWSENEGWADALASTIGAKPLGVFVPCGYVKARLWDFSGVDWDE